jgi:hypothetical protein
MMTLPQGVTQRVVTALLVVMVAMVLLMVLIGLAEALLIWLGEISYQVFIARMRLP